jgi:hypothetical protein
MSRQKGAKSPGDAVSWMTATSQRPHPLFSLRLLGLQHRLADVAASIILLLVLIASRWAAFPASIWEQDEAYFGCGIIRFDVTVNHPHPPWFPLWIAIGKVAAPLVDEPTRGLQIVSAWASIWALFPLLSLWCCWLRRELALAATLLYLLNPAAWVLSGRAFSEPLALLLLLLALAIWFGREPNSSRNMAGSIAAGLCLLTRAHFALPLVAAGAYQLLRSTGWKQRLAVVVPPLLLIGVGYGAVLIDTASAGELMAALSRHGGYHFGELAGASLGFGDSGIARAFLVSSAALIWIGLALLGAVIAWSRRSRFAGFTAPPAPHPRSRPCTTRPCPTGLPALLLFVVLPLVILVYGLSWAGHVRYALPLVALGWGFALIGLARLAGRWSVPIAALLLIVQVLPIVPELTAYRSTASPPAQAVERCLAEARRRGAVVVTDRTLASFFEYERLWHGAPVTVLHDSQIGTDTPAPPVWLTVAIFDDSHGSFVGRTGSATTFSCDQRWLRRLSQGRFLDITVATEAEVYSVGFENP